jgi:acetyltransferase-like isoleucine patch superfamily enzyme
MGAKIGPRAAFGARCRIDRPWGVVIGAYATFEQDVWLKLVADTARVKIGDFTFLGTGSELDVSADISIGDHTLIAPYCFITDHSHGLDRDITMDRQPLAPRPVLIGSDVWIGTKACILPGVTIGDGAVVGAGSVVRKDVAPYTIVAGVPARPIGERTSGATAAAQ